MPLRNWGEVEYLPILGLRPAEMRALGELPDRTKDRLLPLIPLRPWVTSKYLKSSIGQITSAYGDRPVIVSLGEREVDKDRPVFAELEQLRNPNNGFANWCDFQASNERYIPVPQLGVDPAQEGLQIERLFGLGRGLAVYVEKDAFGVLRTIAARIAALTNGGEDVCFILDYAKVNGSHLLVAAQTVGFIETIQAMAPYAAVSVSASSFPVSFANLPKQDIWERRLYDEVAGEIQGATLIYSDRGSARAESINGGGGGEIPARIDYPTFREWHFFRDDVAPLVGYKGQAKALKNNTALWNGDLRVWGTQMIERTARGDLSAIDTPGKATAVRINLHLQLQTFYSDRGEVLDTEDDWED